MRLNDVRNYFIARYDTHSVLWVVEELATKYDTMMPTRNPNLANHVVPDYAGYTVHVECHLFLTHGDLIEWFRRDLALIGQYGENLGMAHRGIRSAPLNRAFVRNLNVRPVEAIEV